MTEQEMTRVARLGKLCELAAWGALRADVIGWEEEAESERTLAEFYSSIAFSIAVPTGDHWL